MNSSSTAEVAASDVAKLVAEARDRITQFRTQRQDQEIISRRESRDNLRKVFFWLRPLTEDAARDSLPHWYFNVYSYDWDKLSALEWLADYAFDVPEGGESKVRVCLDDMKLLQRKYL